MPRVSFYTPWKNNKNQSFSDSIRGYRKIPAARNGLRKFQKIKHASTLIALAGNILEKEEISEISVTKEGS